jgi:hypothetical protein
MRKQFNPGKNLYELYRKEPPARRGASHVVAYWHGYDGVPFRYVKGSYAWWAYKAGKEAREREEAQPK